MQNANLKKETSLFEWFLSDKINNITSIIQSIGNSSKIEITPYKNGEKGVIMGDGVFSSHYFLPEFLPIYERRYERFLNSIKKNPKTLFIRFEVQPNVPLTYDDIENFLQAVKSINSNTDEMKLLIFRPDNLTLEHPFLIIKNIDPVFVHGDDPKYQRPGVNKMFVETLKEIGYNCHTRIDLEFDDRSIY
jgi:hypothetical protein